jgi:hypothetical protein
MPSNLGSGTLISNISSELSDNNAGLISAYDVRHNMEDAVFSIRRIVASGESEAQFIHYNPVRVSSGNATNFTSTTATSGDLVVESGILFDNPYTRANNLDDKRQVEPWLGEQNINHNNLDNLTVGDPHTQYYALNASRALTANFKVGNNWIHASGDATSASDNIGLFFEIDSPSDITQQTILVSGYTPAARREESGFSNQGGFKFMDNSIVPNGKGTAKAWIQLNTSGEAAPFLDRPEIFSYHNISGVRRDDQGKFTITFTSGTFENNKYVAVGTANGRTTASSPEDFEVNTVGIVERLGDDGNSLRTCSVAIVDTAGAYQDSELVDIVFFGYSPGETSGTPPTVSRA